MSDLPRFRRRNYEDVLAYIREVLTNIQSTQTSLHRLDSFDDGHFRAIFYPSYFSVDTAIEPTKSQWNNLKKKLKRHDPRVFIFKTHGEVACDQENVPCLYIDFGFFEF